MKIFVSIASFCDPYLEHTISDAVSKASSPENLVFGVVDQHPNDRRSEIANLIGGASLRYVHAQPTDSRGVCWARSLVNSLYEGEDYVLQIDSHSFFDKDWDAELIAQHAELLLQSAKPIISIYPPGFEFDNNVARISKPFSKEHTMVLRPRHDSCLTDSSATLKFVWKKVKPEKYVLGCHVAGGFFFASGSLINEVPYDPHLYFHGEEQSLAIRAWTRGWDIFHPHYAPIFHLYKIKGAKTTTQHWNAEWEAKRDFKWADLQKASEKRLADLLFERKDLGAYGLGRARTLREFAEFSGIDYLNRRIVFEYRKKYDFLSEWIPGTSITLSVGNSRANPSDAALGSRNASARRVGVMLPTHGRPDFARQALLQISAQSHRPDVVVVHQNGSPQDYSWCCTDLNLPFELYWINTPAQLRQHLWYAHPLKFLLEQGCSHFFWMDHDDIYLSHHIELSLKELEDADWRISTHADIIYVEKNRYLARESIKFDCHAPGGMSTSMAFRRPFAELLCEKLIEDKENYYSDNVVRKLVMPQFNCHFSSEITTRYVAHKGTVSSASWVDKYLK